MERLKCLGLRVVFGIFLGLVVGLAFSVAPALADMRSEVRGDEQGYVADGDRLFRALKEASTEREARAIELTIWFHWMKAPDAESAALMNEALTHRRNNNAPAAIMVLDRLIEMAPSWSEAWNQRATMLYFNGDYEASLLDIEKVLEREPRHFGAMSGMAVILLSQGRAELAQSILRDAVAVHPYLRERGLIVESPGKDI